MKLKKSSLPLINLEYGTEMKKAHWNIPVLGDLDKEVFEIAHELRISKAEFIRIAVRDRLNLKEAKEKRQNGKFPN